MATFILYPRVEKLVCLSGAMPLPSPPSARPPYACKLTVAMRGGENLSALHFRNTTSAEAPQWVLIRQDQDRVIGGLLKESFFSRGTKSRLDRPRSFRSYLWRRPWSVLRAWNIETTTTPSDLSCFSSLLQLFWHSVCISDISNKKKEMKFWCFPGK